MKLYIYRCIDKDMKIVTGELLSKNRKTAIMELKRRQLMPISAKTPSILTRDLKDIFTEGKPLSPKTLHILSSRFYVMVDSGLDFQKALSIIAEQSKKDTRLYNILRQIKIRTGSGDSLFDAFSSFSCFPDFFISMVKIGEKSGSLPAVFKKLTDFYEWEDKSISDIRSAMMYPAIISVLLLGVVIATLTLIIPAYSLLFESNGILLPLPSRILISISNFVSRNILILLTAIIILTVSAVVFFSSRACLINPSDCAI